MVGTGGYVCGGRGRIWEYTFVPGVPHGDVPHGVPVPHMWVPYVGVSRGGVCKQSKKTFCSVSVLIAG